MPRLHWIAALGIVLASRGARADDDDDSYDAYAAGAVRSAEQHEAAGEYLECVQELAPVTWQASRLTNGDIESRLDDTLARCREQHEAEHRWITADKCHVKIDDAIASIAVPRAMAPKSAKRACLALMPGPPEPDACPRLELVWKTARGVQRRRLAVDGGGLADDLWCCKLDSLGVGRHDGDIWVSVAGTNHPCGGGTAYESNSTLYRWDGKALTSPVDQTVAYH